MVMYIRVLDEYTIFVVKTSSHALKIVIIIIATKLYVNIQFQSCLKCHVPPCIINTHDLYLCDVLMTVLSVCENDNFVCFQFRNKK